MTASLIHLQNDAVADVPWEDTIDLNEQETLHHSPVHRHHRHIMKYVVPCIVVAVGWTWYQRHFPSWDEAVMLSDGRLIEVHRTHTFNAAGALLETSLTFDLPEMRGKRTWKERLYPAIVDVYQGQVYVVGDVPYEHASGDHDAQYGYVAYVYHANGWQRVPFASLPESIRQNENIAGCTGARAYKTWKEKQTGWCSLKDEYVAGASRAVDLEAREALERER